DVILIDAPCSGEGLFRKDKGAIDHWSEESCNLCVKRQRRILSSLYPALKPDGILIYCTCAFNPEENEENVKWLMDEFEMECLPLVIPEEWNIAETLHATSLLENLFTYSFYPHRT